MKWVVEIEDTTDAAGTDPAMTPAQVESQIGRLLTAGLQGLGLRVTQVRKQPPSSAAESAVAWVPVFETFLHR